MIRRCLAVLPAAWAAAAAAADAQALPAPGPLGGVVQVLGALALVLLVVLAMAWLLRRSGSLPGLSGWLRVQGAVMVGPRERLVLVEVGDTWLVVGVAGGRVSLVHTLPRPADAPVQPAAAAGGFAQILRRSLQRRAP